MRKQGGGGLRAGLLFGNLIITAICIFAMAGYFVFPLWRVEASITLTPEIVNEVAAPLRDNASSDDEKETMQSVIDALAESNLTLTMNLTFETMSFIESFYKDNAEVVSGMIESNVSALVEQMSDTIDAAVKPAVKAVVKASLKQQVRQSLKDSIGDGDDASAKAEEVMDEIGLDDAFIDEKMDAIMDAIMADDANVDSVTEAVLAVYDETVGKIADSKYGEEYASMSEEEKNEIRDNISESVGAVISKMADEDGNINFDDMINNMILQALKDANSEGGEEETAAIAFYLAYTADAGDESADPDGSASASDEESASESLAESEDESAEYVSGGDESSSGAAEEKSAAEQIKEEIKKLLLGKIPAEVMNNLSVVMKVVGGVILFTLFTWAYLILKILLKIASDNPGIKLKLPIFLGWLPFLVLVLIPSLFMYAFTGGMLSSIGLGDALSGAKMYLDAIKISFRSGALCSFAAAVALIVVSIFYCGKRRKLKRLNKDE